MGGMRLNPPILTAATVSTLSKARKYVYKKVCLPHVSGLVPKVSTPSQIGACIPLELNTIQQQT